MAAVNLAIFKKRDVIFFQFLIVIFVTGLRSLLHLVT